MQLLYTPRQNVIGLLLNYYIFGGRARVFSPTTAGSGTMYTRWLRRDSGFRVGGVGAKFRSASTRPANQPCARFSAAHRRHRRQQFFADTSPALSASHNTSSEVVLFDFYQSFIVVVIVLVNNNSPVRHLHYIIKYIRSSGQVCCRLTTLGRFDGQTADWLPSFPSFNNSHSDHIVSVFVSSRPCLYNIPPTTRTSQRRQSPRRADDMRCSWPPDGSGGCACCARARWPINASTPRTTTLHKQVALPSVMSRPVCLARPGEDRPSDLSAGSTQLTTTPNTTTAAFLIPANLTNPPSHLPHSV